MSPTWETISQLEDNVFKNVQIVPQCGDNYRKQSGQKNLSLVGKFQGHFLNYASEYGRVTVRLFY